MRSPTLMPMGVCRSDRGEAGVGKTRLVAEMITRAEAVGARVVCGSCLALGAESLPYAPFTRALGQLAEAFGVDGVQQLVGTGARADLARWCLP